MAFFAAINPISEVFKSSVTYRRSCTPELFKIWLRHFNQTIDENFKGDKTEQIKTQALSIATIMQIKIIQEKDKKM